MDFFNFNKLVNLLLTNLLIFMFDIIFIVSYELFKFRKFSYFFMVLIGCFVGIVVSVFLLDDGYGFVEYLGVISYFIIDVVFLSYSLYFDEIKNSVFEWVL